MIFSAAANLGGLMTDINNQNSKPWYFKLHWQVLFALVVGVAFGWLMPRTAEDLGFVGDLFLNRLNGPDVEAVQRLVDGVLELPQQALVLLTALLASVGAAGGVAGGRSAARRHRHHHRGRSCPRHDAHGHQRVE
jgi:hypothetical protein